MYKACNPEHDLRIYVLMYRESNEEERYLCSLRREQLAFEQLIREQGVRCCDCYDIREIKEIS